MAEWSLPDLESPINVFDYQFARFPPCFQETAMQPPPPPPPPGTQKRQPPPPAQVQPSTAKATNTSLHLQYYGNSSLTPKGDSPREIRNRAEKMRRDRLNQSVAELAAMVPTVVAARRKIDKTTVLRLTAHYLRAHQHVFGDSIGQSTQEFTPASVMKILSLFNGFLITVTYRGIVVVVSQNVHQYLGYTELDLLGQNLLNITHEDDREILKYQLMPKTQNLGPSGELLIPDEPGAKCEVGEALAREKRQFIIRLKKLGQRSEPSKYVTCHVEGSLRKSDRAGGFNRCCQIVRRVRARTENPCSSGNDIVFIGIVRATSETFINESALEGYRMEYRTRHSIDGQIIQCESRIALVTGYMTHEVSGVNAMNFMHRDDVRWVIIALRDMYDQHKMYGESCYRLMAKNGQFIYMRTRGRLDVDKDSRACTSFVCTNTVVDEEEGKYLIKKMRKKFTMLINNANPPEIEEPEEEIKDEENDNEPAPVENPRRLEEVILHLVTNLPSPAIEDLNENARSITPEKGVSPSQRITIIPPNKEKIVSGIEKIYNVIKWLGQEPDVGTKQENNVLKTVNRRASCPTLDHGFRSNFQDNKIIELGSSSRNKIIHIGEMSNAPFTSTMTISESENILNNGCLQNSTLSPSLDCFDKIYGENSRISYCNFNNISENSYNDHDENVHQCHDTDPEMNFFPLSRLPEEPNFIQVLPDPSTLHFQSGTKRHSEYDDEDIMYKKKIGAATQIVSSDNDGSNLENILDETIFATQIETEVDSLDTIDPTFPDLLVSKEVQDILGQLESEQHQEYADFE